MSDAVPFVFDPPDPEAEERALAEGEADIEAGRCVPHSQVAKWLATRGTSDYRPMPETWWK